MNGNLSILDNKAIIIYDGVCGVCNKTIQFILNNKPNENIRFVAFQSPIAQNLLEKKKVALDLSSIILIENEKIYSKSTAVLKIMHLLQTPYRFLYYFIIIPKFIRNTIYSKIAKYRYLILGKTEQCRILTSQEKQWFLG